MNERLGKQSIICVLAFLIYGASRQLHSVTGWAVLSAISGCAQTITISFFNEDASTKIFHQPNPYKK